MSEKKHKNRQAIRSRSMLQEALVALLKEKPYQKITITEITERADLARPTFYAHFETKDDLLLSYVDDILDVFFIKMGTNLDPFRKQASRELDLYVTFFRQWQQSAEIVQLIRTADIDMMIINRLRQYHVETYHTVIAPQFPELTPSIAGYYIDYLTGATFGLLRHWMDEKMQQPPEVVASMLIHLTGGDQVKEFLSKFGKLVE